ncbi:f14b7a26-6b1f-4fab-8394-2ed62f1eb282-CDS [Sclerotinia trifoliorum]|uniref:F14b7a26-6b1f-4fab-8394-2ed62f1eb282-CDS n=1 Tax=Sclerotinia trifoliorum TaxID=28548 RepID=A0A8H2ZRD1_9HELO|nr:f14b7a26-6b1f-4fab-8394-2ed62f1eb282-CDS [Sclerotinia trifoliorum]
MFPSSRGLEKHEHQIQGRRANLLGPEMIFELAIKAMLFTHYGLVGRWLALTGAVAAPVMVRLRNQGSVERIIAYNK